MNEKLGPWTVRADMRTDELMILDDGGQRMARICGSDGYEPDNWEASFNERLSIARLMAAAPEMLAACEQAVLIFWNMLLENYGEPDEWPLYDAQSIVVYEQLRAVIAKAKGES